MSNKPLATFYRLCAFFGLLSAVFAHILPPPPPGSRNHNSGNSFESSSLRISQTASSSSSLGGSAQQQQSKYPLSFPPASCTTDMDCIGRNASSRLYFDPFGRCDTASRVCACREGYHRVQLRVKSMAPIYISKCVPDSPTELEAFLRSTSQHYYGRACLEDRDCEANLICRPLNPAQSRSRNLLPPGVSNSDHSSGNWNLYANRTKRCRCPNGQHWNKHSRRCEWPHYEQGGAGGGSASGNPSPTTGTVVSGSGSSHGYFSPMSIDLKLFEIVLEVAFLIACLLGYRACSKNCCRDDEGRSESGSTGAFTSQSFTGSKDGATSPGSESSHPSETCDAKAEVKSDEESIISRRSSTLVGLKGAKLKGCRGEERRNRCGRSSSPYGSGSGANLLFSNSTSNFRRLSSVSASMSRSSSASTRNLLVRLNPDNDASRLSVSTTLAPPNSSSAAAAALLTSTPCYNCRIYKEVYSPTARCKSCRSSLASVVVDDAGAGAGHHGSSLDLVTAQGGTGSKSSSLLEFENGFLDEAAGSGGEGGKKGSLLLLPPYKQKPIRRSEEVGVPPHLRAPYRDSQPFWLK
ncbi:hypothetical protein TYRP_000709 [Tyrophagus putrescentiae]|nr:hypothetical protein TYRP_000709 [Tyrophagus putrescentiae]